MALFNCILHQVILGRLTVWGLKAFPGSPRWVWIPHVFWPAQPYFDLEQATTISQRFSFFPHFPHSYYRMPVHHSYESLCILQCFSTPGDTSVCGFISFVHLNNQKNLLNEPELQNVSSTFESISKSDSPKSVDLSNFDIAWAFPGA